MLTVVFFRIMSGLIYFTVKSVVLITNVTIICGKIVFCLGSGPNKKYYFVTRGHFQ